jgi:hypothetical protein
LTVTLASPERKSGSARLTIDTAAACEDRSRFAGAFATGLEEVLKVLGLILFMAFGLAEASFDCAAVSSPPKRTSAGRSAAKTSFDK